MQAFADGYTDFGTHLQNIQSLGQTQAQGAGGIAQDKQQLREAMCNAAVGIASAVRAYAVKVKNNQLASLVDFSLTDLMGGRDTASAEKCQQVHDAANANVANLANYGVTAAKITALQQAITAYKAIIESPRQARAAGKTATDQLSSEFDATDLALNEEMDNLVGQFQSTNAKFVSDYNNARTIIDAAASHQSQPAQPTPPPTPHP